MICFSPLPQHDEGRGSKPASPGDESEVRRLHLLKIGKYFADKHGVLSFDPDKGEFSVKIEPAAGQANGGNDELTKLFKEFESHQEEDGSESEDEDISKSSSSKKTLSPSAGLATNSNFILCLLFWLFSWKAYRRSLFGENTTIFFRSFQRFYSSKVPSITFFT